MLAIQICIALKGLFDFQKNLNYQIHCQTPYQIYIET